MPGTQSNHGVRQALPLNRIDKIATAAEEIRSRVEQGRRKQRALLALKDEVEDTRTNDAPYRLRHMQDSHVEAGISADAWDEFLLRFAGDVDQILATAEEAIQTRLLLLTGPENADEVIPADDMPASTISLLPVTPLWRRCR